MNRQKIGIILFWIGVISIIAWQVLNWIRMPMNRANSPEELSGTLYALDGFLFLIESRVLASLGLILPITGVLLYSGEKGSYFWLLGLLPSVAFGAVMLWEPSRYLPMLFGIGGAAILLSYLGILWLWTRTYAAYEGIARTGRHVQLLGYSFLVITGLLLCLYIGNPRVLALAHLPSASAESINMSLALSMLLLFMGHYLVARSAREITDGLQEAPHLQPGATD